MKKTNFTLLLFILFCFNFHGQNNEKIKVEGIVVDTNNEPVIGAVISVENSVKGTVSDLDGKFLLEVDPLSCIIVRYADYYYDEEVEVDNRNYIKIILEEKYPEYYKWGKLKELMSRRQRNDNNSLFIGNLRFDIDSKMMGYQIVYPVGLLGSGSGYLSYQDINYNEVKVLFIGEQNIFVDKNFDTKLISKLRNKSIPFSEVSCKILPQFDLVTGNIYKYNGKLYLYDKDSGYLDMYMSCATSIIHIKNNIYQTPDYIIVINRKSKPYNKPTGIEDVYNVYQIKYKEKSATHSLCDELKKELNRVGKEKLFIEIECID